MGNFKCNSLVCFLIGFFLFGNLNSLSSQNSFSVSADTVFASKPADNFVFYNYFEFGNNTSDTLLMRWEKVETISSNPGEPGDVWNIGIQNTGSAHDKCVH